MDADLQDSPDEIPELYRMITKDGYDLVSGWKQKRYDPISKTLPTKLFNATARKVSGIKNLHDFNCGLKAYRKEVVKHIEVYGEMHRYIPYLAKNAGFKKIGEKVVHHQARKYGTTKFGLNRFVNGYLDLLSLWFLSRFGIKPMHFFGLLGSLMFLIGMISVIIVGASKLYAMYNGLPYRLVTDSPYFYLSLTAMIIGTLGSQEISHIRETVVAQTAKEPGDADDTAVDMFLGIDADALHYLLDEFAAQLQRSDAEGERQEIGGRGIVAIIDAVWIKHMTRTTGCSCLVGEELPAEGIYHPASAVCPSFRFFLQTLQVGKLLCQLQTADHISGGYQLAIGLSLRTRPFVPAASLR
jgi:hypothetical protein